MRRKFCILAIITIVLLGLTLTSVESASAQTSVETGAVNWAIGQIGSTSYYDLCLTLAQEAYQDGAGFNIEPLTNYGTFNSNTYPQQVWDDGFNSGTTGGSNTTPPYGALVFFNDPSNYTYSHVMVSLGGGNNVSAPDAYNESDVHYETLSEAAHSGAYATYVGWWLPDGTSGGSGPPANGSFVSYNGNGYAIAGGAPLYVSNWATVGNPTVTPIDSSQWSQLSSVPANGTFVRTAGNGAIFEVAGGAPMYVSNCSNISGGCGTTVNIDPWDIANEGSSQSGLKAVPVNGTFLTTAGNGAFFEVAGGAAMYVSNCSNISGGCGTPVSIDQWDIANEGNYLSGLYPVPTNGTFLTTAGNGAFFEVAGGAAMYVSNCSNISGGCGTPVSIDQWDIANEGNYLSGLYPVPTNGTFLTTAGNGAFFEVAGGAALYVNNCSNLPGGCGTPVSIDQWDIANEGNYLSGLYPVPTNGTVVEGLPSTNYWEFDLGGLLHTSPSASAVPIEDTTLSTFDVDSPPVITSASSASFVAGRASSFDVKDTAVPTGSFTETGRLPVGIAFSSAGKFGGTPAAGTAGAYPITITASNGIAPNATQKFTLTVLPIGITTSSLPAGKLGTKYSATLKAAGGNSPYTWSLATGSKPLPPGLKLSSAGVISGTPTKKGTYSFTVKVVDTKTKTKPVVQHTATKTLTIVIT